MLSILTLSNIGANIILIICGYKETRQLELCIYIYEDCLNNDEFLVEK